MEKQNNQPYVSVIIPTYNRGYIIEKSIRSILNQTYKNIEIIVVDDQSTDNTSEIIEALDDERIRYLSLEKKLGAGGARQFGINLAKYNFISFHDSDDIAYPNKIALQISEILEKNLDVVACQYVQVTSESRSIIPDYYISDEYLRDIRNIINKNFIGTPLLLGKKEIFKHEKFNPKLKTHEDWDLAIRLIYKYRVGFLNEVLYEADIQPNSLSMKNKDILLSNAVILKNCLKLKLEFLFKVYIIKRITKNLLSYTKLCIMEVFNVN